MSKLRMLRGAKWMPWFVAEPIENAIRVMTLAAVNAAFDAERTLQTAVRVAHLYAHRGEAR